MGIPNKESRQLLTLGALLSLRIRFLERVQRSFIGKLVPQRAHFGKDPLKPSGVPGGSIQVPLQVPASVCKRITQC